VLELTPLLARDHPHDLELVAVGVVAVERLRRAVVALADEGTHAGERGASVGELADRRHLPCEVVEADAPALGPGRAGADREQAEVVVVLGALGLQEHGDVGDARDDLELERLLVEGGGALGVADVEDGVVQALDGDHDGTHGRRSLRGRMTGAGASRSGTSSRSAGSARRSTTSTRVGSSAIVT
jgi:hypothetical protein